MKKVIFIFLLFPALMYSQIEYVPISNAVYPFLINMEAKGFLPHYSTSELPWQGSKIQSALKLINQDYIKELSESEKTALNVFMAEFDLISYSNSVLFYSSTDSNQVFSEKMFDESDKYIFRYSEYNSTVKIKPLFILDGMYQKNEVKNQNVAIGTLGFRFYGSLSGWFGYYLQATNGRVISGERSVARNEPRYNKSIKFIELHDDIDLSESHVAFQKDWFSASIGRQSELLGAGLNQRIFISNTAPPMDALTMKAVFSSFEYRYSFCSIIGEPTGPWRAGFLAEIPSKYLSMHRISLKPSWGEISFWDALIFSNRNVDLAYLTPLSFFKSLEHALRDRDNSIMGIDATYRPIKNLQIKSSFLLDDIIFEQIGKNYWSNKTALNIAVVSTHIKNLEIGVEYARIEPFTFTHFNRENAYTNDSLRIGSILDPNSDQVSAKVNWWWGSVYPLAFNFSYTRHGANTYDGTKLIKNVGGDVHYTRRGPDSETGFTGDPYTAYFMDGNVEKTLRCSVDFGYRIFNGFNFHLSYTFLKADEEKNHLMRLTFGFDEF